MSYVLFLFSCVCVLGLVDMKLNFFPEACMVLYFKLLTKTVSIAQGCSSCC